MADVGSATATPVATPPPADPAAAPQDTAPAAAPAQSTGPEPEAADHQRELVDRMELDDAARIQKQGEGEIKTGGTVQAVGTGVAAAGAVIACIPIPPYAQIIGAIVAAVGAIIGLIGGAIKGGGEEKLKQAGAMQAEVSAGVGNVGKASAEAITASSEAMKKEAPAPTEPDAPPPTVDANPASQQTAPPTAPVQQPATPPPTATPP